MGAIIHTIPSGEAGRARKHKRSTSFVKMSTARLAQSAERKALNLVVVGSSPTVGVCFGLECSLRQLGMPLRGWHSKWTHWGLNPGPSACEADVIPLHHVPDDPVALSLRRLNIQKIRHAAQAKALLFTCRQIRGSIVVSISACHAEDPGSIPGRGVLLSRISPSFQMCLLALS